MNLREKLKAVLDENDKNRLNMDKAWGIERIVKGKYIETCYGHCFVSEHEFPLTFKHGSQTIDLSINQEAVSTLCGLECNSINNESLVFFDTETTGLTCGGGSYIFLAGIGYFKKNCFIIDQYFLKDLGQEQSFLTLVKDEVLKDKCLVTYNGKSFDVPFLETRLTMNGFKSKEDDGCKHIDLLHHARRIWKEKIGSCSLSNVEEHILGFKRENDIPGSLIPTLYFSYLSSKDPRSLKIVFFHNMYDILSLVVLLKKVCYLLNLDEDCCLYDSDIYKVGLLYEKEGNIRRAEQCFRKAIKANVSTHTRRRALWSLSILLKREERFEEAVSLWQALINGQKAFNIRPHVELAKYYEHKTGEISKAMEIVENAIGILKKERFLTGKELETFSDELKDIQKRLKRLKRKNNGCK